MEGILVESSVLALQVIALTAVIKKFFSPAKGKTFLFVLLTALVSVFLTLSHLYLEDILNMILTVFCLSTLFYDNGFERLENMWKSKG